LAGHRVGIRRQRRPWLGQRVHQVQVADVAAVGPLDVERLGVGRPHDGRPSRLITIGGAATAAAALPLPALALALANLALNLALALLLFTLRLVGLLLVG